MSESDIVGPTLATTVSNSMAPNLGVDCCHEATLSPALEN